MEKERGKASEEPEGEEEEEKEEEEEEKEEGMVHNVQASAPHQPPSMLIVTIL